MDKANDQPDNANDIGTNGVGVFDFDLHSEPGPSPSISHAHAPSTSGSVTPGVKDSDGFLTPPPASTLLIRRTRTNSSGSSTYVVASPQGSSPTTSTSTSSSIPSTSTSESLPSSLSMDMSLDIRKSFSVPYRRLHKKSSRDRRGEPSYKRISFTNKKVNVLLTPHQGPHVQINVPSGNGLHRSSFPPISPLAIDPSHALSVTLSSDRSISTVVPIDSLSHSSASNPFVFPSPVTSPSQVKSPITQTQVNEVSSRSMETFSYGTPDDDKSKSRGGKPVNFMSEGQDESQGQTSYGGSSYSGKGMPAVRNTGKVIKRKRGERGPDRFPNIDPSTGKRRYIRKKRFTLEKRSSNRGSRLQGRSHSFDGWRVNYDHELAGKWRPTDDLRLMVNVQQINDLELVHRGVRFSCKFTLENIERRWAGLLYNKAIAKVSLNSIQNLHPRIVASIHDTALFSAEEDRILKTVRSTHDPKNVKPLMEKLLKDHALVFLKWRSAKSLIEHWLHLRDYHLLCDQNVKDYFAQESFSEFEDNLTEQDLRENNEVDPNVRREILIENHHTKKMIRTLEEEVSRWQVLADMVTEIDQTPFEEGSFAMLRGKQVRYLMRSREITLGRRTPTSLNVDADLSMEGSTYKVSRRQAMIQLRTLGDFVIANQGKHAIYVDGNAVMPKKLGLLVDQSVIEISQLRFVFLINHKLVAEQRKKWIRLEVRKEMMRLAKIARFIKAHPAYPIVHPSHPINSSSTSSSSGASQLKSDKSIHGFSNNALATIDSVASASNPIIRHPSSESATTSSPSTSTTRYTGSLTRPPQPPKYSASSSTSTTFIRSFIPPATGPPPSTSNFIPRITSAPPLFRKPAPPPPIPTIITPSDRLGIIGPNHTDRLIIGSTNHSDRLSSSPNQDRLGVTTCSSTLASVISIAPPAYPKITKHVAIHSKRPVVSPISTSILSASGSGGPSGSGSSILSLMDTTPSPASVITPPRADEKERMQQSTIVISNTIHHLTSAPVPLALPLPPAYTSPFPTAVNSLGQRSPTVLITPSSTPHSITVQSGALSDLTIRPGQPPPSTSILPKNGSSIVS